MKPSGAWLARLAMAGACLAWAGCGKGDVPDPDSDPTAAAAEAPPVVDKGAAPAAPEAAPEVAAAPAPEAAPAADARPAPAPAVAEAPAPAETPAPAPAVKGDASGTEDMLRIATGPAPAAGEAAPAGTPAPGEAAPPAVAAAPPGERADTSRGAMPGMASPPPPEPSAAGTPGPAAAMPGMAPMPGSIGTPAMPAPGGPGDAGGLGMPGMMPVPGDAGGLGGPGSDGSGPIGPNTFKHPWTAAAAFLSALTAKDKDKLAQTTALRAPTEAVEKHRKIFAAIIEQSISDDELDEMSKAMAGFKVVGVLPAKSTGRIGILIGKMEGRDRMQRTLTIRKEKEGWKVMDISGIYDFKPGLPPMISRGRRR